MVQLKQLVWQEVVATQALDAINEGYEVHSRRLHLKIVRKNISHHIVFI